MNKLKKIYAYFLFIENKIFCWSKKGFDEGDDTCQILDKGRKNQLPCYVRQADIVFIRNQKQILDRWYYVELQELGKMKVWSRPGNGIIPKLTRNHGFHWISFGKIDYSLNPEIIFIDGRI